MLSPMYSHLQQVLDEYLDACPYEQNSYHFSLYLNPKFWCSGSVISSKGRALHISCAIAHTHHSARKFACQVRQLSLAYLRFADQFSGGPLVYKYCLTPLSGSLNFSNIEILLNLPYLMLVLC